MTKDTPKKKREFGVILESIESKVQNVLEGDEASAKRLDRIEERVDKMDRGLTQVKDDVAVIKLAVQGTEEEKPLRQELADLKKRMAAVEAKVT